MFTTHAGRYGRRLRAQLRREGHAVGRQRLHVCLSTSGLRARCTRASSRPPRTTQANPQAVAAANKLATWPAATAPNQIWVGDITYLALATGQWAYLACWRDAFSRRVVGWHVSESLDTDSMLTAFNRAVAVCQPPPGLLVHADRGSQYTSEAFTTLLDRTQAIASLSRPGNPYDNALAESGWSTLKTELLPRGACFADVEEARLELAEYLDHYYNTQRLHSALGYCTPLEVELHYLFNLS
ncbi:IS3 family transposase [Hymenobacter nivis]|uniref:IS3 family transposase n=1 Tax=Hymenobacter nivis TaxID=1850093 RepID=A0A2Z3GRS5_9BACT|nr:IS3 family transposase [Hymenobacter nivis]AWM35191.1 IS3 family transposase [Hymenobacter nivis]